MGPDEFTTREELSKLARLLMFKMQVQAETLSELGDVLVRNGLITPQQFQEMLNRLTDSPNAVKARKARADLDEYLAIRKIARQYLDPPEE